MRRIILTFLATAACWGLLGQNNMRVSEQHARTAPEWLEQGIMYQVQPRAFTPEGTLPAATKKLKKVAELGATIVYLCPVFVADDNNDQRTWSPRQKTSKMNNPRNPYRIMDYYHVDAEYGTDDDLKEFVQESHRLGLRVMLDMVYYHCGANAVFLKDHPDFIVRDENGNSITGGWNWPKLNYENPDLREYLFKNMEYWVKDFDVDGFRCDVASGVPLDFWETARTRLEKIRPDIGMLAEAHENSRPEDQLKAFDAGYGFEYFNALKNVVNGKNPVSHLRDTWNEITEMCPQGSRFIRYFDNHDISNDDWHNRREKDWGFDACNALFVHLFTLNGIPFIYNGQEIADTARHSIFGKAPIAWDRANTYAGQARFSLLKNLCDLRKDEKALTEGDLIWLENDHPQSVLSYLRKEDDREILIIVNLSNYPVSLKINSFDYIQNRTFKPIVEKGIVSENIQEGFTVNSYGYWVAKSVASSK